MLNNDAWSAVAELAASQHGCFTISQAATNGISRRRLNRALADGLVERPLARVLRFSGSPISWHSRLMAACLSSGGVASHRSAAHLHEFDGMGRGVIDVSVARGRMPAVEGVILHRWTDPEPTLDHALVHGIPCTSVAATLAQLGSVVAVAEVEKALDSVLRDGSSLHWIRQTLDRLDRPGPSGTAVLRRVLSDRYRVGPTPDSWFERLTQKILLSADVPTPVLQHEIATRSGRRFRLDFAWPDLALGLECHSRKHHFGPTKEARDNRRDLELAAAGWELLYMTWSDHRALDEFVPLLAQTINARRQQRSARPA